VRSRVNGELCVAWSEKDGSVFTQPPTQLLENLVAVRIHLDQCDEGNGPLRVVPRSQQHGRIERVQVSALRAENGEQTVTANRGDALLMRPLLLHSSSKAINALPRRVLHFVFGPRNPGFGLDWEYLV
jgi:ectoine hydroxylase-related dioxygenase (phytanoyl-CoA dioxygenase family)